MNLHLLLKREIVYVQLFSFVEIYRSMCNDKQHLLLFFAFDSIVLLGAIFYYVANHKPYQSNLIEITDTIKTPISAGQGQFGSARWLGVKEKEKHFKLVNLDLKDEIIQKLVEKANAETIGNDSELYELKDYDIDKLINNDDLNPNMGSEFEDINFIENGGIVLGMNKKRNKEEIYFVDEDTHTLCIGATRSGKSRCVVLETIGLLGLAGESMIISDPKSELYNYTSNYLKELGYVVSTLDFRNPLKSDRYNFLQPIIDAIDDDDLPLAIEATWDLTASLVPEDSHNEKIWSNGEASIIAAAIMAVVYDNRKNSGISNRKYQNMTNVYFFISEMCKTINGKMPLESYLKSIPSNHPARGLLAISEVAPSKTRGIHLH